MTSLAEIKMGELVHDSITGVHGNVTGKLECITGDNFVLIEGADTSGRPFTQYVALSRVERDSDA